MSEILDVEVVLTGDDGIALSEANGYYTCSFGPGVRVWIKQTTTAPHIDGRDVVSRRLDVSSVRLSFLVKAATHVSLWSRVSAALAALEQDDYAWTLQATIEGIDFEWSMECADSIQIGDVQDAGDFDAHGLRQLQQRVTALLTRDPTPIHGPV